MPSRAVLALRQMISSVASAFRPTMAQGSLSPAASSRGWLTIFDSTVGAWQRDETPVNMDRALANWTVYACLSLIASDMGKIRIRLVEQGDDEIWREVRSAAFSPVLKKPNGYQTRQKFIESWVLSKLGPAGNTYVLKERDNRGLVVRMHVLDPMRVTPLVAPNGAVFYRLGQDHLAELTDDIVAAPASEIIHDRAACLFHPLVGIGPIYACGLAATQGLNIQSNSEQFFRNRSMPGGIITAPAEISEPTAERIKREWNARYTGENAGRTAMLGDGMKYEPFGVNARDSQLAEQLNLTATMICSTYHVPPFKVGIGALPAGQKVGDMNLIYYSDCLQALMEAIEALLDEGLGLEVSGRRYGTEFDTENLLRMDEATRAATAQMWVGSGITAPNEARLRENMAPVEGGESPMIQQQNYSLAALAKRDAKEDPFATAQPSTPAATPVDNGADVTALFVRETTAQAKQLKPLMQKAA